MPAGDADFERYIGTWTVTSTSAEKSGAPQTFTIQIEPYRVNESFRVSGWGITTMGNADTAPFLMDYADGKVSISTKDYYGMVGLYYVYLKYRFYDPEEESTSYGRRTAPGDGRVRIRRFRSRSSAASSPTPRTARSTRSAAWTTSSTRAADSTKAWISSSPDYLTSDYSIGPTG